MQKRHIIPLEHCSSGQDTFSSRKPAASRLLSSFNHTIPLVSWPMFYNANRNVSLTLYWAFGTGKLSSIHHQFRRREKSDGPDQCCDFNNGDFVQKKRFRWQFELSCSIGGPIGMHHSLILRQDQTNRWDLVVWNQNMVTSQVPNDVTVRYRTRCNTWLRCV